MENVIGFFAWRIRIKLEIFFQWNVQIYQGLTLKCNSTFKIKKDML